MQIIAHRGHWLKAVEKNTFMAFEKALASGYGIETDIRDYNEALVISHDIPNNKAMTLDTFFELYSRYQPTTLALNIKCDGLTVLLKTYLEKYKVKNYFVFDMSVPDTLKYFKENIPVYERLSEYEKALVFTGLSDGVWLDGFNGEWYLETLNKLLIENKKVCLVSPELHGRDKTIVWSFLKSLKKEKLSNLLLCTDFPDEAKEFFYE